MIVTAELQTYERKTFQVKAIRVTPENISEIAQWTGGGLRDYGLPATNAAIVDVPIGQVNGRTIMEKAHIGDWVTCLANSKDFRVYRNKTFLQAFQASMEQVEKYTKVHELLLKIARAQDAATFHGDSSGDVILLIEKTAHEICEMV